MDGSASRVGPSAGAHYDDRYFSWQVKSGTVAGALNKHMFQPFIGPGDAVLDFGCGGGYLLADLKAGRKLGVDVNPSARDQAHTLDVDTVASLAAVPDGSFDVAISCHALEHTEAPLDVLRTLKAKLRVGGRAVIVVPWERADVPYKAGNIHQHLYTWSPMTLGNLVQLAGFKIESVQPIRHSWPPMTGRFYRLFGHWPTMLVCWILGRLRPGLSQVRAVARRAG